MDNQTEQEKNQPLVTDFLTISVVKFSDQRKKMNRPGPRGQLESV